MRSRVASCRGVLIGCDLLVSVVEDHHSGRRRGLVIPRRPVRTAGRVGRVRGCPDARSPVVRRWARHSSAPLVLAACDIDPPVRARRPADAAPPPPEDSELVAAVVAALVRAQACSRPRRSSRPRPGPRLLAAATPTPPTSSCSWARSPTPRSGPRLPRPSPGRSDRALTAVRRSEQRLLREVRAACVAAASGDLARVLASVAASTAQHSAASATVPAPGWRHDRPRRPPGDPRRRARRALHLRRPGRAHLAGRDARRSTTPSPPATAGTVRAATSCGSWSREAGGEPVAAAAAYDLDGRRCCVARSSQAAALDLEVTERRDAGRPGAPVDRDRARVGAHRGDVVGDVAARAGRRRRRPGRAPPSSAEGTRCRSRKGKRPAASAFGKVPRSLPKAEDADRSWGWSASPCVAPPVGVAGPHAQSCIRSGGSESGSDLHVPATHKVAGPCHARSRGQPPLSRRDGPRGSRPARSRSRRARPRCGRPAPAGIVLSGTWIARRPGVVRAPDVVEEPVPDVDAGGRVAHARRPPSRRRRRAATAWSTGSRWCRRHRRRGRRPRRARRSRRATPAARWCWTARRP